MTKRAGRRDRARPFGNLARRSSACRRGTDGSSSPARWTRGDIVISIPALRLRWTGPSISPKAGAFDRFWRSLVAQGASAGEGLSLSFGARSRAIGSRVRSRFGTGIRTARGRRSERNSAMRRRCGRRDASVADRHARRVRRRGAGVLRWSVRASRRRSAIGVTTGGVAVVAHAAAGVEHTLAQPRTSRSARRRCRRGSGDVKAMSYKRLRPGATLSSVVSVHPMRALLVDVSVCRLPVGRVVAAAPPGTKIVTR